jgi:hypothetical protein
MKITVATMDRAIQAAIDKPVSRATLHQQDRAIYLRGLADAEKVKAASYTEGMPMEYAQGHDAHAAAIRETAKRLLKEIGK